MKDHNIPPTHSKDMGGSGHPTQAPRHEAEESTPMKEEKKMNKEDHEEVEEGGTEKEGE